MRAADRFVFCPHAASSAPDPLLALDPQRWRLFVAATSLLNERCPAQRTLGLEPLRRLVEPVASDGLKHAVDAALGGGSDGPPG